MNHGAIIFTNHLKKYYNFNFKDIDDCESGPCQNGATCVDGVADYSCECEEGWTGKDCEISMKIRIIQ